MSYFFKVQPETLSHEDDIRHIQIKLLLLFIIFISQFSIHNYSQLNLVLLQSDGKQGRDEQVDYHDHTHDNDNDLRWSRDKDDNGDLQWLTMVVEKVSLNLNDISSHTKQMGETSRLVQQVTFLLLNIFHQRSQF